jgi:hypothetical protein
VPAERVEYPLVLAVDYTIYMLGIKNMFLMLYVFLSKFLFARSIVRGTKLVLL